MLTDGCMLYERVAKLCADFNVHQMASAGSNYPSLGLVVGATDLKALRDVRRVSPESWILCPGVGAQGGEADVLYLFTCLFLSYITVSPMISS